MKVIPVSEVVNFSFVKGTNLESLVNFYYNYMTQKISIGLKLTISFIVTVFPIAIQFKSKDI